jgi:asparagine synthase (glutamine-hydrolysing)
MFNDHEKRALYTRSWLQDAADEDTIPWLTTMIPACDRDRVLRRQLHDIETMLHDEMPAKLDRGTMAWSLEGRVPLLDHRVVEFAVSLPLEHRYAEGEGKRLLRSVAARHLPPEILARPKRGFTIPLATWFRKELRDRMYDTLAPDTVRRTGILSPNAVADVLAYYEREPNFNTAHMVFTLLCFQSWYNGWSERIQ